MFHPIKHFMTVTKHRHRVMRHCFLVGIPWQGLVHDISKYSPTEFVPGAKYFQGNRSPNEMERETVGYSLAWMHHKGRNRHHFEYWNDVNPQSKMYEPVRMPIRFVKEMFCDRVAACKIYRGKNYVDADALNYLLKGNARQKMHRDTAELLEDWLRRLATDGEKKTFAYIRSISNHAVYPLGAPSVPER